MGNHASKGRLRPGTQNGTFSTNAKSNLTSTSAIGPQSFDGTNLLPWGKVAQDLGIACTNEYVILGDALIGQPGNWIVIWHSDKRVTYGNASVNACQLAKVGHLLALVGRGDDARKSAESRMKISQAADTPVLCTFIDRPWILGSKEMFDAQELSHEEYYQVFGHHVVAVHELGTSEHISTLFNNPLSISIDAFEVISDLVKPAILRSVIQFHEPVGEPFQDVNEFFSFM